MQPPSESTIKKTRFTCKDADGHTYVWSFWKESHAYRYKDRRWMMQDHEGYVRVFELTWIDSLPRMLLTIENYGFTSSLS